jgi:hypothetical protein
MNILIKEGSKRGTKFYLNEKKGWYIKQDNGHNNGQSVQ